MYFITISINEHELKGLIVYFITIAINELEIKGLFVYFITIAINELEIKGLIFWNLTLYDAVLMLLKNFNVVFELENAVNYIQKCIFYHYLKHDQLTMAVFLNSFFKT